MGVLLHGAANSQNTVLTCSLRLRMIPESSMVPARCHTCGRLSWLLWFPGDRRRGRGGGGGGRGEGPFFISFQRASIRDAKRFWIPNRTRRIGFSAFKGSETLVTTCQIPADLPCDGYCWISGGISWSPDDNDGTPRLEDMAPRWDQLQTFAHISPRHGAKRAKKPHRVSKTPHRRPSANRCRDALHVKTPDQTPAFALKGAFSLYISLQPQMWTMVHLRAVGASA